MNEEYIRKQIYRNLQGLYAHITEKVKDLEPHEYANLVREELQHGLDQAAQASDKTQIEQFHGLANLVRKMNKEVTLSADAILSLDTEIKELEGLIAAIRTATEGWGSDDAIVTSIICELDMMDNKRKKRA